MRVIGGSARSLRLQCPRALQIRPTTDMMRESLFNTLGPRIAAKPFCDLYAGSGSVGIEALSRGAGPVAFIEKNQRCVEAIEANLANTGLAEGAAVVRGDVLALYAQVAAEYGPLEVVFADPPYGYERLGELAERLVLRHEGMAAGGVVVFQRDRRRELAGLPPPTRERPFGDSVLSYFEAAEA